MLFIPYFFKIMRILIINIMKMIHAIFLYCRMQRNPGISDETWLMGKGGREAYQKHPQKKSMDGLILYS